MHSNAYIRISMTLRVGCGNRRVVRKLNYQMRRIGVLPSSLSFALSSPLNNELKQLVLLYDHLTFGENVEYIEMLNRNLMHLRREGQQIIKQRTKLFIELVDKNILVDTPLNRSNIIYSPGQEDDNNELQRFGRYGADISSTLGLFIDDYDTRLKSILINQQHSDIRAFAITSLNSYDLDNTQVITNPAEVLSIVCEQFPTITKEASWEQILEFKNDKDSYLKYLKLLNWATTVSKAGYSVAEMRDYVEFVTLDYIESLRLHKLKFELTRFQAFFIFMVEIIENLAKLKFSDIAKMPIEIRKQKVEMLEEERLLPGSEIAYFIKAQITLGSGLTA